MAEYETVNSFPVVDQARLAARNYGRSVLEALHTAYEAATACLTDSLSTCFPSLRRSPYAHHDPSYDWEDDDNARWSDELERLLDSEGQGHEDSGTALSAILSRLPFIRGGGGVTYKPSAANLRRSSRRNKSLSSIHSNGSGATGESLRSRADLFDHSGDEDEDAGMLPDERIFALTSTHAEEPHPTYMGIQSDVELQDEDRLAEQREEALLQIKRERAQRLAIKRGLSDTIQTAMERPRSAQGGNLRDAIPLRRGRSSTLQSQVSDVGPRRGRSSTLGSQSSGQLSSPLMENRSSEPSSPTKAALQLSQSEPIVAEEAPLQTASDVSTEPISPYQEQEFTEFVTAGGPREIEMQTPVSPTSPSTRAPIAPKHYIPETTNADDTTPPSGPAKDDLPSDHPAPPEPEPKGHGSPPKPIVTTPPHRVTTTTSPVQSAERPSSARRIHSKVPGDYDPVSGYYRRKAEPDLRSDSE